VKFGILLGAVVVACAGILGSMLIGNAAVRDATTELAHLNHAQELVLQLDTRASELRSTASRRSSATTPQTSSPSWPTTSPPLGTCSRSWLPSR
jgi:hypothetical protein